MNIMNKSRKYKKRGFSITKKRRGQVAGKTQTKEEDKTKEKDEDKTQVEKTESENKKDSSSNDQAEVEKIKEEVEAEKTIHLPNLGLGEASEGILSTTGDLIEGATINTLEGMGELVGVDLTDPNLAENNKEKIDEITKNAVEIGTVALEAAAPFTDKLIDETVDAGGHAVSKMGEAGVKVLLNTAEEIPGVGIVIGTLRSLDAVGQAVLSSVNAGSEVVESASDTINASVKNFDRLIEEKENTENRVKASIDEFTGGSTRKYRYNRPRVRSKTRKNKKHRSFKRR
jgi:uncharacterized phage infection (PIP) family protein YhgE